MPAAPVPGGCSSLRTLGEGGVFIDVRVTGDDGLAREPAVVVMMGRARNWSAIDRAMVHLVRLILAEDWDQAAAAARLREMVDDPRMLRRMASRVERALADRSSEVAERAAVTLRGALRDVVEPA